MNFPALLCRAALTLTIWMGAGIELGGQSHLANARPRISTSIPVVQFRNLPVEAQRTIRLIDRGGPFPYQRDGIVFSNREGRLPTATRGTYREYTVPTPGASDRGARRIITGNRSKYYTPDHYRSFQQVQQ